MYHDIFKKLSKNTLILTANRRLSKYLAQEYKVFAQKKQVLWETPNIVSLTDWLEGVWVFIEQNCYDNPPILLNDFQETILWQHIIQNSESGKTLFNIKSTANLAKQARNSLKLWNIDISPNMLTTENQETFYQWLQEFNGICQKNHFITSTDLYNQFLKYIPNLQAILPKNIILTGFDDYHPQLLILRETLQQQDILFEDLVFKALCKEPRLLCFSDREQELLQMALWCEEEIKNDPSASIGCIIPELNLCWNEVKTIFNNVFKQSELSQPYNISAGLNLIDYPLIYTAILLLKFSSNQPLLFQEIGFILTSPFLAHAEEESLARAFLKNYLENDGYIQLTLDNLLFLLQSFHNNADSPYHCPILFERLQAIVDFEKPSNKTPFEWSRYFVNILDQLGWPGERVLNSSEYQTHQRWLDLLIEFSQIDIITNALTNHYAVNLLEQLSQRCLFQPQTEDAPIQILGSLESAGIIFDKLWIMNVHNENWPPQANPNPLLPISIQKTHKMPHADPDRELDYARTLTERFTQQAPIVYFSYASKIEDHDILSSPLLKNYSTDLISLKTIPHQLSDETIHIDTLCDIQAPKLKPDEIIKGGAQILKNQIDCPFKAFSLHRLFTKEKEKPRLSLNHKEKGSIIHAILEKLWTQLKTQANLKALSDTELTECIKQLTMKTLNKYTKKIHFHFSKKYLMLEQERIEKLILQYLNLEKERPPFEVIHCEQKQTISFNHLNIHLSIDRIDKLDNRNYLLIDYKTGQTNIRSLYDKDFEEPQLPLYQMASHEPINAIAFSQIRIDQLTFKGISENEINIQGIEFLSKKSNQTWLELKKQWKDTLTNKANEFSEGYAPILPKNGATTCQYCYLHMFCRIHEKV